MGDFIKMLGLHEGALSFFVAFLALPYIYFSMSNAIHKSYAEVLRERGRLCDKVRPEEFVVPESQLLEDIESQLGPFELEWWSLAAVGALMLILFNLDLVLGVLGSPKQCGASPAELTFDMCIGSLRLAVISGAIHLYAFLVAVLFACRLAWSQVAATRQLKYVFSRGLAKQQPCCEGDSHAAIWV